MTTVLLNTGHTYEANTSYLPPFTMITPSAVHITSTAVDITCSGLNIERVHKEKDGQSKNDIIGNLIGKENGG